ncbi:hypothetical protein KC221_21930, partial [Mycobacterium tuberculosis]|nr:hypothetical protein [Mycobacterium tuberculosis]
RRCRARPGRTWSQPHVLDEPQADFAPDDGPGVQVRQADAGQRLQDFRHAAADALGQRGDGVALRRRARAVSGPHGKAGIAQAGGAGVWAVVGADRGRPVIGTRGPVQQGALG